MILIIYIYHLKIHIHISLFIYIISIYMYVYKGVDCSSHFMLANLSHSLDPSQTHYVGVNEMVQCLQRLGRVATERLEDHLDVVHLVRESNNTEFAPPSTGRFIPPYTHSFSHSILLASMIYQR